MNIPYVAALVSVAAGLCLPASAPAASSTARLELTAYPLVAQHSPNIPFILANSPDEAALMLARYDVVVSNRGWFASAYAGVWNAARAINPNLGIVLQIPIWTATSCQTLESEFDTYLDDLGDRKNLIDVIDIDGAGFFASECGQSSLVAALGRFKQVFADHAISPALIINGSAFQADVAACQYKKAADASGSATSPQLPSVVNGTMEEGWIAPGINDFHYLGKTAKAKKKGLEWAKSRVRETCAWLKKSNKPSYVLATHDGLETPWWQLNKPQSEVKWRNLRVGFAAAQMYDNIFFIYNPTLTGAGDAEINPEKMFWGDYYAVDMRTGRPPGYGTDTTASEDDALTEQRDFGGYLGEPLSKAKVTTASAGTFLQREFACGYVYANLSTAAKKIEPASLTRKIRGRQDTSYDDGSSRKSYTVPAGDGLVLLKLSCVGQ